MKEEGGGPFGKWTVRVLGLQKCQHGGVMSHLSLVIRFKWRWSHGYFSPATFSLEMRIVGASWAAALPGECHRGREDQGEFHE